MPISAPIAKFRGLTPAERTFLIAAWLAPLMAWTRLRLFGLAAVQRWLARSQPDDPLIPSFAEVARLTALARAASRYAPAPATCLINSLALVWLLQRRRIAAHLRIGVRLTNHELQAHAWVEHAGVPVNDRPDIELQYAAFAEPLPLRTFSSR